MVQEGDGLAEGGSDFVILPIEVDGVVVVNPAGGTAREVEVEQSGGGGGADAAFAGAGLGVPDLAGDRGEGAVDGAVLAGDFHLEDLGGVLPGGDLGVRQEGDEPFLEGAEAALDFAFGLGRRADPYGRQPPPAEAECAIRR